MTRTVVAGETTLTIPDAPASRPMRRTDELGETAVARITGEALLRADLASAEEAHHRIGEILAMAEEWQAGRLPLREVGRLCTPAERFLAVRFGPRPIPAALLALVDAFIDATPSPHGWCYRTPWGVMTEAEIAAGQGTTHRMDDGSVVVSFPRPMGREKEEDGWR